MEQQFTKYEIARILGARALQLAVDAPMLVKMDKEQLEAIRYDPLKIAEIEFTSGILPITVKRPLPQKTETKLKRPKEVERSDKIVEKKEKSEVKDIAEEGEIMELTKDEEDDTTEAEEEGVEE